MIDSSNEQNVVQSTERNDCNLNILFTTQSFILIHLFKFEAIIITLSHEESIQSESNEADPTSTQSHFSFSNTSEYVIELSQGIVPESNFVNFTPVHSDNDEYQQNSDIMIAENARSNNFYEYPREPDDELSLPQDFNLSEQLVIIII